tara:strand:- start:12674 stop:12838 length:165 start_codon:yes stop_codon:yes gene_type:complete
MGTISHKIILLLLKITFLKIVVLVVQIRPQAPFLFQTIFYMHIAAFRPAGLFSL